MYLCDEFLRMRGESQLVVYLVVELIEWLLENI
uniref:Uncharacterized protein n=1 Tax=Arundo donax TaxID=35708 RepID=A0A0A8YZW0_ARUDO